MAKKKKDLISSLFLCYYLYLSKKKKKKIHIHVPINHFLQKKSSYKPLKTKFSYKIGCNLRLQPYSIFFLLEVNFNKSTIGLHLFLITSMRVKFLKN